MRCLVVLLVLLGMAVEWGTAQVNPIKHVVFIIKENRSFDTMFGKFPGANGATSCKVSNGTTIPLGHTPDRVRDMGHGWADAHRGIDGGAMDQFDLVQWGNWNGDYMSCSQLWQADIPNYWRYAQKFSLSDNTFSSISTGSFPNHLYTVASTSGGVINSPAASNSW